MKRLVEANAKHFVNWLIAHATFVRALDVELKPEHRFADALLEVLVEGQPALAEIEFQTYSEEHIEERLLEYNFLAFRQYGLPVYSYLIYLRKDGAVATSPYIRRFPNGEEVHRFSFKVINLWEIPAEMFLRMGWLGLFPLLPLTKGGKRPDMVQTMIDHLTAAGEWDLLAASRVVGGLVFKQKTEREWFRRRFLMFQDVLRESWVYQEIGQEFLEEGRKEERQQALQRERRMITNLVQRFFPDLSALAQQQVDTITDPEMLYRLHLKLIAVQQSEEARRILLSQDKPKPQPVLSSRSPSLVCLPHMQYT
jgi:predicted transposase YdaD